MKTQQEACSEYIKLLNKTKPGLTQEELALAKESFSEGWLQCLIYIRENIENI